MCFPDIRTEHLYQQENISATTAGSGDIMSSFQRHEVLGEPPPHWCPVTPRPTGALGRSSRPGSHSKSRMVVPSCQLCPTWCHHHGSIRKGAEQATKMRHNCLTGPTYPGRRDRFNKIRGYTLGFRLSAPSDLFPPFTDVSSLNS